MNKRDIRSLRLQKKLGVTRSSVNAWESGLSAPTAVYIIELSDENGNPHLHPVCIIVKASKSLTTKSSETLEPLDKNEILLGEAKQKKRASDKNPKLSS